jgi:hypothetical protein
MPQTGVAADEERVGGRVAPRSLRRTLDTRLEVPALLRKTLLSTNPIESMFSLVRHSERNIKRTRGSRMLSDGSGRYCLPVRADSSE